MEYMNEDGEYGNNEERNRNREKRRNESGKKH